MSSVLDQIVARSRVQVKERRAMLPLELVQAFVAEAPPRRSFAAALSRTGGVNVISEYKRRSPSKGVIREDLAPQDVARGYAAAGAAALSILTDEEFFGGKLDHLTAARGATEVPVLRKDFVVDAYQIWEARAAGADAVLLIVAALSDAELVALLQEAGTVGLDVLVEVHDGEELARAAGAGAGIIGVNNRNLKTMEVRLETALELAPRIPAGVVKVAESGIKTGAEIKKLRGAGFDAFLIGEHLMLAPDPGAALSSLIKEAQG
jgi:indole-3-glycerol phosphate synthase